MTMHTKVVEYGNNIDLIDCDSTLHRKNFTFEREPKTKLTRLIHNNFDGSVLTFLLLPLVEVNNISESLTERLNMFMEALNQPCLAILHLDKKSIPCIFMMISDSQEITSNLEHYEQLWGDKIRICYKKRRKAVRAFIKSYGDTKTTVKDSLFKYKIKSPRARYDSNAEAFIKKHDLIHQEPISSIELFEPNCGWITITRYHVNTSHEKIAIQRNFKLR